MLTSACKHLVNRPRGRLDAREARSSPNKAQIQCIAAQIDASVGSCLVGSKTRRSNFLRDQVRNPRNYGLTPWWVHPSGALGLYPILRQLATSCKGTKPICNLVLPCFVPDSMLVRSGCLQETLRQLAQLAARLRQKLAQVRVRTSRFWRPQDPHRP